MPAPVDILLTDSWPTQVTALSAKPPSDPAATNWGVPAVSDIVSTAKPRYHFATGESTFWEREPFGWPTTAPTAGAAPTAYTRFISLGNFGDPKQRWFYAFNIAPIAKGATQPIPPNATPFPLTNAIQDTRASLKRGFGLVEDDRPPSYIFEGAGNKKQKRQSGKPPEGYKCRICVRLCAKQLCSKLLRPVF